MKSNILSLALLAAIIGGGCGGGTTGSSSTAGVEVKQFKGEIHFANGTPVVGATVTLAQTGDGATTDSTGSYAFQSNVSGDQQTIIVRSNDGRFLQVTTIIPGADGNYESDLTFSTELRVAFRDYVIDAKLGGACAGNFGSISQDDPAIQEQAVANGQFIGGGLVQFLDTPNGASCRLTGTISKAGVPLTSVPFEFSAGGCHGKQTAPGQVIPDESLSDREKLLSGETGASGDFSAPFTFDPGPGHCNWAVVIPNGLPAETVVIVSSEFEAENT